MGFVQKLGSFLASTILPFFDRPSPESDQQRSQPEQPPSLQQPATSTSFDVETPQPQRHPPSPSPSVSNDYESPQPQFPSPAPTPTTPPNLKQLQESLLAAQHHLQWQNSVLAFCFSYALGVSLQFMGADQSNHHLPFPLLLLSFLVLLAFIFILVAFFIHPNSTRTSQALEKLACLLAAAAFCHTLSIPFSFELKCAIWAVFLLSLFIVMIFAHFYLKTA
ncbi:hypothetical protein PTKIN_Ptkin11bG0051300 [Pterospermum kingtungense]